MTLALIIPVRNDQAQLSRLLKQARAFGMFDQIVVVDDGSDVPVSCPAGVTLLRQDTPRGAGAARNHGLGAVQTTHLIFFDSDDLFTADMPLLWQDLRQRDFDVCLFRHNDSRVSGLGGWGQMPLDNALWRQADVSGALFEVAGDARNLLAQTANYPWNKVYRTAFVREAGLRCSETMVHNDIALHWHSLAKADRILGSNRVAAHHHVNAGSDRLTNTDGRSRLVLFDVLQEAAEPLGRAPDDGLWHAFLTFTTGLLDWVRSVLRPELHAELDSRAGTFWRALVDPDTYAALCTRDPLLALRLALQMAGGRVPC